MMLNDWIKEYIDDSGVQYVIPDYKMQRIIGVEEERDKYKAAYEKLREALVIGSIRGDLVFSDTARQALKKADQILNKESNK